MKYDHPLDDAGPSPPGKHLAKGRPFDPFNTSAAATHPHAEPATPHFPERSQLMQAILADAGGQASLAITGGVAEPTNNDRRAKRARLTPSPPKKKRKKV